VEKGDFELRLPQPGWILRGSRSTNSIVIKTAHKDNPPLESHKLLDRILEQFTAQAAATEEPRGQVLPFALRFRRAVLWTAEAIKRPR